MKSVIKVECVSCCVINTEWLRYWIEGNEVSHDTGPLMTVHKQDTDGRTCSTEESTPMVYKSASPSGSSFPPSSIRLLELAKPAHCMFLHRTQTYISVHTSVQIRTHELNVWKIVQNTHPTVGGREIGVAAGWDTALQSGRSRVRFPTVSLEIFIDINLLAWCRLSL